MSGLAEPAGAVVGLTALQTAPVLTPLLMAFAAGAMLFVAVHELLPMAKHYGNPYLFAAGMGLGVLFYVLLAVTL